jgi:hypothetical protein
MLSQKDIIHISIEVIVISSLFLFVNWKNSKLRNEIMFLSNRLDRLEQIIASQNELLARLDPRFRQLSGIDDVSMMPFGSLASMMPRNTIATQTEEPNPVVDVAKGDDEVAKVEVAKVEVAKVEVAKVEVAKVEVDDDEVAKVEVDDDEVANDEIVDLQDIVENKVDDLDFDQLLEQELDELKNG